MMRQKSVLASVAGLLLSACGDAGITDPQVAPDGPWLVEDTYTCEGGEACVFPPLIGVVDPKEPDCSDPYQAVLYTDVCGTGGATGDPWSPEDPSDPSDPSDPTGGSTTVPQDTVPCETGDPVLDDPQVQAGFADLWQDSNPDATMANRRERGGWIVQTPLGYQVQPFPDSWTQNACAIDMPAGTAPPAGTVAWVHTHPYVYNELMTGCEPTIVFGIAAYSRHKNQPSEFDGLVGPAVDQPDLPGYIIDNEKVTKFTHDPNSSHNSQIDGQNDRCGY